ncbi:NADP oxidoreductase [Sphaerisporangium rufum]|uniref:NADP oxidoreductase n=1 Tax=Sphaerisporangium rufum TaxID=1381558 RepID=A0A919UYH2_9ACTN|nr:NAD(P)-binding domain-containing protein [Sphaerisporangium rufum]GII76814.1 NADP oxidoreductase [Sphaerisporangium rufum]
MRIGILGAGGMAGGLGAGWARAGHEVMVGGRDPGKAAALAARLGPGARSGTLAQAAGHGEVVLLAVPAAAAEEVLAAAGAGGGALAGRPLIDCTNAVDHERMVPATAGGPSMAERVAAAAPGAHVVKAFNLCHEAVWRMTPPAFDGEPLLVPLCGDDPGALETVGGLVGDLGCVPVDGGGLVRAGALEATMVFMVGLWFRGVDARSVLPPLKYAFGSAGT